MSGVVVGFSVVFAVIIVGYLLGRSGVLGSGGEQAISRLVFLVATPALLFTTLSDADLSVILSPTLAVGAGSAVLVGLSYFAISRWWLRRQIPECTVGALASSYVNAVNLGLPIAVYVLGDAALVAPILLFQVLVLAPIALTVLEVSTSRAAAGPTRSLFKVVIAPLKNPILIGAAAGLTISLLDVTIPMVIQQPITLVAGISVPGALIAFGLSMHGKRALQRGVSPRRDVALAAAFKTIVQPIVAFAIGSYVFGLEGHALFSVVVLATLPTAQNVFVFASWYMRGVILARDAAIVTTLAAIPAIAVGTLLLA
ncbi:AEC family transporter [Hoyosella subflava]|uniref:Auxin Efflux Carrier n=1 Tax=Hoyosella subflava (strain DSM 45089 / JCM 17490 / NBRC 109087 / DQS3-9A1) TaxID=443218 RepID=F6ERD8_HOYSD|nr:AEC family transporter [Hoyosella subflava]AEF42016.1 Auxin Efflux Carrier [Hoyosella subflava DQS3-9A1]